MRISEDKLREIVSNLGINVPFVKGQTIDVKNCWHFSTEGQATDTIFYEANDFQDGMNRVFLTIRSYDVVILAFILMDTHVHFILHGEFNECNRFVHEYMRRTSIYVEGKYGEKKKFRKLPINYQRIDTDLYLKRSICYTIKNSTIGGLPWMFYDYPWSSGSLYFRKKSFWTSPHWTDEDSSLDQETTANLNYRKWRTIMKTGHPVIPDVRIMDGIVFPGEYVAYEIVEEIFKTSKSFLYFISTTKESDIESRGGYISRLSLPDQEIRQHKNELCLELFGEKFSHNLDTGKRIHLAHCLKSRYNCSTKQIARICGLRYDEIKNIL